MDSMPALSIVERERENLLYDIDGAVLKTERF